MADDRIRCRLCLVSPSGRSPDETTHLVRGALSAGDVAAIIVAADPGEPLLAAAESIVGLAAPRGVATLILNDTRIAGRIRADGVQIDTGAPDVASAVAGAGGKRMVGAGGVRTRHDAMVLAEAGPDYLFFGLLDGDREPGIFPRALDLAAWWSEVAVIPAMVMGGAAVASVEEAADAGIDFVALRAAVWNDPRGPAAAVADANARLALSRKAVA
jgi:thiamine-phosphate pyrophosphorylase